MSLPNLKILISGGGTGGHIFPAIAIADAIKELNPQAEILFVGAKGRMEMEKVPAAGYPIKGLWISGLQRSLTLKNLSFPFKLIHSSINARKIVKEFNPDTVVGVGGYASGPTLRAAEKLKIPTVIQEQNSYPGITNKLLAAKANFICVAYPGMEKFFPKEKIIITGNPIRREILSQTTSKEKACDFFELDPSRPVILSVGGSLGALTLNRSLANNLKDFEKAGMQVLWQTGKSFIETANHKVKEHRAGSVIPMSFIQRMDLAYTAADVVISRSGALAISELCVRGKPCILVPSPNVAEDHQTRNAIALVQNKAAIMITDSSADKELVAAAIRLAQDINMQNILSENIQKLGYPDAAKEIAQIVINCATSKKQNKK